MIRFVAIAQQVVSEEPDDVLAATGLGSCVALVLVGEASRVVVAGLAHVLLPDSGVAQSRPGRDPLKFADTAVPRLLDSMTAVGARRRTLRAALVGGSRMFDFGPTSGRDIGERNAVSVRRILHEARIELVAEDVGGACGRTVRVEVGSGRVTVQRARGGAMELLPARSAWTTRRNQQHGASADRR